MDGGQLRYPVFCTADIPTTTLDLLFQCTDEYLSEFNQPDFSTYASTWLDIVDSKDTPTITEGPSFPITSSPTAFLGLSLKELLDWLNANNNQEGRKKYESGCFLVLDNESVEDDSCVFVSTHDVAPGEMHSLRCGFELALQTIFICDIQGRPIEGDLIGRFMRSGRTLTKENEALASSRDWYYNGDGELKLDEAWIDFDDL